MLAAARKPVTGRLHGLRTLLHLAIFAACSYQNTVAQHAQHLPYFHTNLIVMEAENFTASDTGWKAMPWMLSNNRFAASVADTYLSRRAYLRGDANMTTGVISTMEFEIEDDEAGDYQALLRYEAAYNFETPVQLSIAEAPLPRPTSSVSPRTLGKLVFNRTYGQRHSLKVYPFAAARLGPYLNGTGSAMCGPGRMPTDYMQAECWWAYGSTEQVVWEGVGTSLTLAAGKYVATLTSTDETGHDYSADPSLLAFADRNLDVLVLTKNATDVESRVKWGPLVLPLDGMLTQGASVPAPMPRRLISPPAV
eukprot:SAG11_NODE_4204_length_2015_cov_1.736952_2_plen_308_part_00